MWCVYVVCDARVHVCMCACVCACVCMCACQVAQNTGVKNNCFQKEKKIRIIYLPSVDGWVCSMRSHSCHWSSVVTTIQITDTHCWDSGLKYLNNYIKFHQQTMSFVFNPLIPPPHLNPSPLVNKVQMSAQITAPVSLLNPPNWRCYLTSEGDGP